MRQVVKFLSLENSIVQDVLQLHESKSYPSALLLDESADFAYLSVKLHQSFGIQRISLGSFVEAGIAAFSNDEHRPRGLVRDEKTRSLYVAFNGVKTAGSVKPLDVLKEGRYDQLSANAFTDTALRAQGLVSKVADGAMELPRVVIFDQLFREDSNGTGAAIVYLKGVNRYGVSLAYTLQDGSARLSRDYTLDHAENTLSWGVGETGPKSIPLRIVDDMQDEPDETVYFDVVNVTNATVMRSPLGHGVNGSTATIIIVDNDVVPTKPMQPQIRGLNLDGSTWTANYSWEAPIDSGNMPLQGFTVYRTRCTLDFMTKCKNKSFVDLFDLCHKETSASVHGRHTSPAQGSVDPCKAETFNSTSRDLYLANLTAGSVYNLYVHAVNGVGEGHRSSVLSLNTGPKPPHSVTNSHQTTGTITLQWNAPDTYSGVFPSSYTVYRNDSSSPSNFTNCSSTKTTQATITNLTGGFMYAFKISAITSVGEGETSNAVLQATAPGQVPGVSANQIAATTFNLTWNAPRSYNSSAIGYKIYRRLVYRFQDIFGAARAYDGYARETPVRALMPCIWPAY